MVIFKWLQNVSVPGLKDRPNSQGRPFHTLGPITENTWFCIVTVQAKWTKRAKGATTLVLWYRLTEIHLAGWCKAKLAPLDQSDNSIPNALFRRSQCRTSNIIFGHTAYSLTQWPLPVATQLQNWEDWLMSVSSQLLSQIPTIHSESSFLSNIHARTIFGLEHMAYAACEGWPKSQFLPSLQEHLLVMSARFWLFRCLVAKWLFCNLSWGCVSWIFKNKGICNWIPG